MLSSIKKLNTECLETIIENPPMVYEDVLENLKNELYLRDNNIRTRLKNIKLYSTIALLLLDEAEDKKKETVISSTLSKGQEILRDNDFFRDLLTLMNTSSFKIFRTKHMTQDIKVSLIYFELYEMLCKFYREKIGNELPDDIAVEFLKTIMEKKEYRTPLIKVLYAYIDKGGGKRDKLYTKITEIMFNNESVNLVIQDH